MNGVGVFLGPISDGARAARASVFRRKNLGGGAALPP